MTPKKILYTVENLNVGGLEKVISSLALGLDKSRYSPEVWCLADGGKIADELIRDGIAVRVLNLNSYYNPFNILRLSFLLRRGRFSILHTHGYFAGTFSRPASILAGVPVRISHVHSTYSHYSRRNLLIERLLSHFTDRIICVSKAVQSFVTDIEGIRKNKTCVIYNGVDRSFADDVSPDALVSRESLGIGRDEILLVIVASITPNKGHRLLIEAFHNILKKGMKAKLLIVGDGFLRNQVQEFAGELGIASKIIFTGERNDVSSLLKIADIYVLPSIGREGLPIALIEALAAGLPVIVSRIGGIPEVIVNRMNGLLFEPGDSSALSGALLELVQDESLRKRLGHMGRQTYSAHFTSSNMLREIESLYDGLLENKGIC